MRFEEAITDLPDRHKAALRWFAQRAGTEHVWPAPLPDGTLLSSKAKGIYKPQWSQYALSVRQTLGGPYPDRDPVINSDGSWSFLYFQENPDPSQRDAEYTNRGLLACAQDHVPIGVMRQVSPRPTRRYGILGVAIVAGWQNGYFVLEGFSPSGQVRELGGADAMEVLLKSDEQEVAKSGAFDVASIEDARLRTRASIVVRRGQSSFRDILLEAYSSRCAVTGCDARYVLEASHIIPYQGPETNHPSNGLLLRADVHLLFDLGMLVVDTATMKVLLHPNLSATEYGILEGRQLNLPAEVSMRPSIEALGVHRRNAGAWATA